MERQEREVVLGGDLLARFEWISYLFAGILLIAAVRLVLPSSQKSEAAPRWITWISRIHPVSLRQDKFFVREEGRPRIGAL